MRFRFDDLVEARPVLGKRNLLELSKDWYFRDGVCGWKQIWIPKGYTFECSIPWAFRWLLGQPTAPEFWQGACAHDWSFETHALSFSDANNMFSDLNKQSLVPRWKDPIMRFGVKSYFARETYMDVPESSKQEIKRLCDREDGEKFLRTVYVI